MATYREMVYMVLDALKLQHDDSYYTEEHVLFLLGRMRALLLMRKYAAMRSNSSIPDSVYQEICVPLQQADMVPGGCSVKSWLKSTFKIPDLMGIGTTSAYALNSMVSEHVAFIPQERMPFVGYNKWLRNIIYVAIGNDNYLYLTSANPQAMYLKEIKLHGIFEDAEKAGKYECEADGSAVECDILDRQFPLEEGLQAACIEYVVQELIGSRYAPQDKHNNATDDLSEAAVTSEKAPAVARDSDATKAAQAGNRS